MSVRRFEGSTTRDVMRQVRDALGDDALIVANRRRATGVEILAMAPEADQASSFDAALDSAKANTKTAPSVTASHQASSGTEIPAAEPGATQDPPLVEPPDPPLTVDPLEAMSQRLLKEMQDMRALLESQPSVPATPTPVGWVQRLHRLLFEVGFSVEIANEVLARLPEDIRALAPHSEEPFIWLREQLSAGLKVLPSEQAFLDPTGIVALVGPTGVGKTTSAAKLSARLVMRHGTRPVALVTTDSFRVGAHEQLRIYARLLDIPMYALDTEQPLDTLVGRLSGKSWVVIDTVGMSQRDQRVIDQINQLQADQSSVRLVLLLNAASQPETLEEVVLNYRQAARAAGVELNDCLLTKQDEAGRLGPVLDIVMRHGLRVLFTSHGQQVPEDMALAHAAQLIGQALDAPRHPGSDSASTAPGLPRWSRDILGHGRQLSSLLGSLRQRVTDFDQLEAIWDLVGLPVPTQQQRLTRLLAESPQPQALGMLWQPRRHQRGSDWRMPDIGLDANGRCLALGWLQHRQPAGWQARLDATLAHSVAVHLLPMLPDAALCAWLERQHLTWVAQAGAAQRVTVLGERQALKEVLGDKALTQGPGLRLRGQPLDTWHRVCEVITDAGLTLQAWYLEACDPETHTRVAKRYWLTPSHLGEDALSLLVTHLEGEGIAPLTRRAWQQLKTDDGGQLNAEVRLLMATGCAAVAQHLDLAQDTDADSCRGELLGLLSGGRRRRRDTALLDAVMRLLMAQDAIRKLGRLDREGIL